MTLPLVYYQRLLLADRSQTYPLTQSVHFGEVIHP
jgi:hypothetical protein